MAWEREGLVTLWEQGECDNMSHLSTEEFLQCTSLDVRGSSLLAVGLGRDLGTWSHTPA